MTFPTKEQSARLESFGWKWSLSPGYSCGVCHREIFSGLPAWCSPLYKWYHLGCVMESKQVMKILKETK